MRIAVVGAGIGGLVTAGALLERGFRVEVYERGSELKTVGAGITVASNAARILNLLGHGDIRRRGGVASDGMWMRYWKDGRDLSRGLSGGGVGPAEERAFTVHRVDLCEQLYARLPDGTVQFRRDCVSATERPDSVLLSFSDGSTASADAVVAADGLNSTLRRLRVSEPEAVYAGRNVIRGIVETSAVAPEFTRFTESWIWVGKNRFVLVYPICSGAMLNVVASFSSDLRRSDEWGLDVNDDHRDTLRQEYAGWHQPIVDVLDRMEITGRWGMFDRDPIVGWSSDRITLLGDAAHPMLPLYGQGANQAIEDAWVLTECLAPVADDATALAAALHRYAELRQPRTAAIQERSRQNADGFYPPADDLATVRAAAEAMTGRLDRNYTAVMGHRLEADVASSPPSN